MLLPDMVGDDGDMAFFWIDGIIPCAASEVSSCFDSDGTSVLTAGGTEKVIATLAVPGASVGRLPNEYGFDMSCDFGAEEVDGPECWAVIPITDSDCGISC